MNTATGIYFDGQVARGRAVTIEFTDTATLRLSGEGIAEEIDLALIQVSDRLGDVPRFIYLPNGAVIETPDNATVDAALGESRQSRGSRLIHALESQHWIAVVGCVVLVAAIAVLGFYGPPALARVAVKRAPAEVDRRIGAAALRAIRPYFHPSALSKAERTRVEQQLTRLRPDASAPRVQIEFLAMNGGLPNAFALPGNVIVMTDELVRLPATDDEIAAVLAHELGHLELRHGLQSLLRSSFAVLIVASVTGDLSALTSFAGTIPLTILSAGYSRDLEREADRYALDLLRARKITPRAFVTVLAKLEGSRDEQHRASTYLSTHPATDERMALFGGAITPAERKALLAAPLQVLASDAMRLHNYTTALVNYDRLIAVAPSAQAYAERARCHYEHHDYADARADCTKALELEPKRLDALITDMEILASPEQKFDRSLAVIREILAMDPKNSPAIATRGYIELIRGDLAAAAVDLDRATKVAPSDYRGWAYHGLLMERQGKPMVAAADYSQALKLNREIDWVHHNRGMIRMKLNDYSGSLADLTEVQVPSRRTADYFYQRGMAKHALGQLEAAIADYSQALEKKPEQPLRGSVHWHRSDAYIAKGDFRAAIRDLDAAVEADPKNGKAYLQRALARYRTGNSVGALADLDQAAAAGTDEQIIVRHRAEINWDLGRYPTALRELDRLVEKWPRANVYRDRATLLFSQGDYTRAEADLDMYFSTALPVSPEYTEFIQLLNRRFQKVDDQREIFAASIAGWKDSWAKSVGRYLAGQIDESRLLAEIGTGNVPSRDERHCEAYYYIGITYLLAGDRRTAVDFFQKCVGTGCTNYYEYKLARAELAGIRKAP